MTNVRPTSPGEILLPREIVLASAGTGKTYTLSSRLIGLLAGGAPPDTVLASTFTRKAAGEILARVLARLARASLDENEARKLAEEVGLPGLLLDSERSPSRSFSTLLRALVRDLHRINVGTLDSFFVRISGSFAGDLGMPPEWVISDEPTAVRLESEALQEVLSAAQPAEMAELVRMTMRGESGRGVHRRLLSQLKELRSLLHQLGPSDPESVWRPPRPGPVGLEWMEGAPPSWEEVCREMEDVPIPTTSRGTPDSRFQNAICGAVRDLKNEDWSAFCEKGLGAKVLGGEDHFHGKPITREIRLAFGNALGAVGRALGQELAAQNKGLRALVTGFDQALSRLHRREGAYRFEDITYLLAREDPMTSRTDLWYRLDQTAHHLLLDEFQDTSRPQWEALQPLAEELLAGHPEERSALIVADPKQSIYGWRGAEPSLAGQVAVRFGLQSRPLHDSYRSSRPILELVNQVFTLLPDNPIWDREPDLRGAVQAWAQAFQTHRPARELPGYVGFEVGPQDPGGRNSDRPALMAWVAERIRDLQEQTPGASIGVLVRRNAAVARIMSHLRRLGMDASEEGATALTDSPGVSTCLALLRLSDHPGDTVGRYQVARSPLGALVGLKDYQSPDQARTVALRVRNELLTLGYGAVIGGWTRELGAGADLDDRELARMLQLVELAYRWEARSTLRPGDFVHFVETEALEAPSDAAVRVMTVHKAKGLEFDIVVLPELDLRLTTGKGLYQAVLPLRDPKTGRVTRIFPSLNRALQPLFPEVAEAGRQDRERELQDALGVVYVALTRARHALYLFTGIDPQSAEPKLPFTPAGLLRGALGVDPGRAGAGPVLFETGTQRWWEGLPLSRAPSMGGPHEPIGSLDLLTEGDGSGRRILRHRSPSSLKGTEGRSLAQILSLDGSTAKRSGTLVHAWLERLHWVEDWAPDPEELLAIGRGVVPDLSREESEDLQRRLHRWLGSPEIRTRLQRDSYPAGSQVLTEVPFAFRWDDTVFQGRIDRLVLIRDGNSLPGAEVLDFKTDGIDPRDHAALQRAAEGYGGQVGVYRQAVADSFGIPLGKVRGLLVFLAAGVLMEPSG